MDKSREATQRQQDERFIRDKSQDKSIKACEEIHGPLESPTMIHRLSRPAHNQTQGESQGVGLLSLRGLLAAQRFSKTLRARAAQKIATRKPIVLVKEQIPAGSAQPTELFPCTQVSIMLQDFLFSHLEDVQYSAPCGSGALAAALSKETRALVKTVCPARYRLVVTMSLRQRGPEGQDGGLPVASRCLWDNYTDTWVSHTYRSRQLVCVVSVFAVYCE